MNVIISVIGKDRVGIIRDVSTFLADLSINIIDISQTLMGEYFTMIMRANTEKSTMPIDKLIVALREKGESVGLDINLRSEEIFNAITEIINTEVIADGYFHESEFRSAPYFDLQIDGITLLDTAF